MRIGLVGFPALSVEILLLHARHGGADAFVFGDVGVVVLGAGRRVLLGDLGAPSVEGEIVEDIGARGRYSQAHGENDACKACKDDMFHWLKLITKMTAKTTAPRRI